MTEADPGPTETARTDETPENDAKTRGAPEASASPDAGPLAQKRDRWVAVSILGLAFALSLAISWRSGEIAEEHQLLED